MPKLDAKTQLFMEFFEKELGCKFFDVDSGKYVNHKGEEIDEKETV